MSLIERDEHRIVVLQCDECGEPRVGCRSVDCALNSRPYAGEDVVPADQLAGAVGRIAELEHALDMACDALRAEGHYEAATHWHTSLDNPGAVAQ